jgi:hypothetical protein
MSWDALAAWGDVEILRRFDGGIVNDVRLVNLDGTLAVARLGKRSEAALDWERNLLAHLATNGLGVPRWIPTTDGRFHVDGLIVMNYVEGHEPANEADWNAVALYLSRIHHLTQNWHQRPGYVASTDLVRRAEPAEVVDITSMPAHVVDLCRQAWRRIEEMPQSAVHGDVNANNVSITKAGVVLLDWDESRVDVSAMDFGRLPAGTAVPLDDATTWSAQQADAAWDAASCWNLDRRLALQHLAKVAS